VNVGGVGDEEELKKLGGEWKKGRLQMGGLNIPTREAQWSKVQGSALAPVGSARRGRRERLWLHAKQR